MKFVSNVLGVSWIIKWQNFNIPNFKKHVLIYSFYTFEDRIDLQGNMGLKSKEYTSNYMYGLPPEDFTICKETRIISL